MTDTKERWIKVGTALGMVPDGVSSKKTGNFLNFFEFFVHGPFKSICRSGANPEKVLCIRGGAMQVYHHNQ